MLPSSQFQFNGKLNTNAPDDLFVALGKNGQSLNIVPSQNMVWIRMGNFILINLSMVLSFEIISKIVSVKT